MNSRQIRTTALIAAAVLVIGGAITTMVLRNDAYRSVGAYRAESIGTLPQVSDAKIAETLNSENLGIRKLSVRSFNGIVILRGHADAATAARAVSVTRNLGVERVANLITPATATDDDEIRREAERSLASSNTLDGTLLRVSVEEGVISVSGRVQNDYQRDAARSLLRAVRGAREVRVDLVTG